jgi:uncharacterized protein
LSVGELNPTARSLSPEDVLAHIQNGSFEFMPSAYEALDLLIHYSGFPEPFFSQDQKFLNIWRQGRTTKIVREDLRDLSRLPELSQIEMLVSLLPERVAQPLSRQSLREDIEVAYTTISRWLNYLGSLYYFYEVKPYSKRVKNPIKKEGNLYLWDPTEATHHGAKFENTIANHLLKACHFWTDTGEGKFELYYLKNKLGQEIDFLITRNQKPWLPIEVKSQKTELSPNWNIFMPQIGCPHGLQLVKREGVLKEFGIVRSRVLVLSAHAFLSLLP